MPPIRGLSISIVALVLGLLMAFQFRTYQLPVTTVAPDRAQALTQELKDLDREVARLSAEAAELDANLGNARHGVEEAMATLTNEVTKNRMLAGLIPVEGPGIELILSYGTGERGAGNPLFALRDQDLLWVINQLNAASAEAIAINDQRIVERTEIRLIADSFINVNLTRIDPPYRIVAIGNPDDLVKALAAPDGVVPTLEDWGVGVELNTLDNVIVPSYTGDVSRQHAKPAAEGGV